MGRILLATLALVLCGACSSPSPRPTPAAPRAAPPQSAPPSTSAYPRVLPVRPSAFPLKDTPLEQVVAQVASSGKRGLLYFCADWCGFCFKLTQLTMSRPDVQGVIRDGFVAVEYDVDTPVGREVAARFGARGFPTLVVIDGRGQATQTLVGFRDGEQLIRELSGP